jgi:phospholipid transport system substrate-binding protein
MKRFSSVLAMAVVLTVGLVPAWAGAPTDDLRGYVDRAIVVLEKPEMKGSAHAAERLSAVRAIAGEGLDMQAAARHALGAQWEARTPAERARFTELFAALIDGAYLTKVSSYDGEKVAYDSETVTGDDAVVKARVIAKDGDVTPVEFRLIRGAGGRWRMWDAQFEGMSLVDNYRAQFSRIIRTTSFEELVKRLEARARALKVTAP